jgi:hypothetical protein
LNIKAGHVAAVDRYIEEKMFLNGLDCISVLKLMYEFDLISPCITLLKEMEQEYHALDLALRVNHR